MQPESDVDRQSAKLDTATTRSEKRIEKLLKQLDVERAKHAHIVATQTKRANDDPQTHRGNMLRSAQGDYMSVKREEGFGMDGKVDKTKHAPVLYDIFEMVYKSWIRGGKKLTGVAVNYKAVAHVTRCKERRNRDLVLQLIKEKHLFRCSGGKGRADHLMVIPTRYPLEVDPEGHFSYSEELAEAEMLVTGR